MMESLEGLEPFAGELVLKIFQSNLLTIGVYLNLLNFLNLNISQKPENQAN